MDIGWLADQFDRALTPKAVRIGHFEMELSRIALRHERQSKQENSEIQQARRTGFGGGIS